MLNYRLNPIVPECIDQPKTPGEYSIPAVRSGYCVESNVARSLKADGYVICGLIATARPDDLDGVAHSLFEICSSEKVFPVLLTAENLMTWKRYGFTTEWYSPDHPNAETWLSDVRDVWGMDIVTDLSLFIEAHGNSLASDADLPDSDPGDSLPTNLR